MRNDRLDTLAMRLGCAFLKHGSAGRAALLIQLWWKRFVDTVNARTSSTYRLINDEGGAGGGSSGAGRARGACSRRPLAPTSRAFPNPTRGDRQRT